MRTKRFAVCAVVALLALGGGVWAYAVGKAKTDSCCADCCPECIACCAEDGGCLECSLCCLEMGCDPFCCFPANSAKAETSKKEQAATPVTAKQSCGDGCCK